MERDAEPKLIASSRRYVLAEDAESYVVWDLEGEDEPLGRYPKDEAGYAQAQAHYKRLRRSTRMLSRNPVPVLGRIVAISLPLWIIATAVQVSATNWPGSDFGDRFSTLIRISSSVEQVAFAVSFSAVSGLIAIFLVRRLSESARRDSS